MKFFPAMRSYPSACFVFLSEFVLWTRKSAKVRTDANSKAGTRRRQSLYDVTTGNPNPAAELSVRSQWIELSTDRQGGLCSMSGGSLGWGAFLTRFISGFIAGCFLVATSGLVWLQMEETGEIVRAAAIGGIVCGLLAWLFGDAFWEWLGRWW